MFSGWKFCTSLGDTVECEYTAQIRSPAAVVVLAGGGVE